MRVTSGWVRASPSARRRAAELGVDLATVHGSGPSGAVILEDVEQATRAAPAAPAPAPAERNAQPDLAPAPAPAPAPSRMPLAASMRLAIAAAMARSNREIPHYYLAQTIDMRRALEWLRARNESRPIAERMLPGIVLLRAAALALRKFPDLNGTWQNDTLVPAKGIHPGLAVSLRGGGLVIPAIHDADAIPLDALVALVADVVQRARAGRLRSSELTDGTITITSLGEQGVEAVFGVIYPPQVALVGFGKIVERPWAVDGMLAVHPLVTASLAGDHRASDGHRGALYLAALDRLLQEPEKL